MQIVGYHAGDLVQQFRKIKPDAIGLSGLLVKSAQQMVTTGGDLHAAGIDVPLLVVGGLRLRIADLYKREQRLFRDGTAHAQKRRDDEDDEAEYGSLQNGCRRQSMSQAKPRRPGRTLSR